MSSYAAAAAMRPDWPGCPWLNERHLLQAQEYYGTRCREIELEVSQGKPRRSLTVPELEIKRTVCMHAYYTFQRWYDAEERDATSSSRSKEQRKERDAALKAMYGALEQTFRHSSSAEKCAAAFDACGRVAGLFGHAAPWSVHEALDLRDIVEAEMEKDRLSRKL